MAKTKKTEVQGIDISYHTIEGEEYINLTDIARYKDSQRPEMPMQGWMNTMKTIEFLLAWEEKNNPDFIEKDTTDIIKSIKIRTQDGDIYLDSHNLLTFDNKYMNDMNDLETYLLNIDIRPEKGVILNVYGDDRILIGNIKNGEFLHKRFFAKKYNEITIIPKLL